MDATKILIEKISLLNKQTEEKNIEKILKDLLSTLLIYFEIDFSLNGKTVIIKPLEVEAYYYADEYIDECVHAHYLQKNRFGKIYIHRYKSKEGKSKAIRYIKRAGMDLVLSDNDKALAVLIRTALVNGKRIQGPANLVKTLFNELSINYSEQAKKLKNSNTIEEIPFVETSKVLIESNSFDKKIDINFSRRININRGKTDAELRATANIK